MEVLVNLDLKLKIRQGLFYQILHLKPRNENN